MDPIHAPTDKGFHLTAPRRRAVLSLAPLIDVTFILLIFFMLVTQFTRPAPLDVELGALEPALSLPDAREGTGRTAVLRLVIHDDGRMDFADRENLKLSQLAMAFAAAQGEPARREPALGTPVIVVDPDETVPLQLLIDVIEEVQNHPEFMMKVVTGGRSEGGK